MTGHANSRQPDTDKFRQWQAAGTSHLDAKFSRMLAGLGLRVSGMDPVEGSPSIAGPTISGGAGNGAAGNGDGGAGTNVCVNTPFSRIPEHYVLNALLDHTARWIKDGTRPPTAPPIELKQLPPAEQVQSGRDGRGPQGRAGKLSTISSGTRTAGSSFRSMRCRSRPTPGRTRAARQAVSATAT